MNNKIKILLAVIVVLLIAIYISKRKDTSHIPDMPDWEESADEIIIKSPVKSIRLYKKDDKWVVNEEAFPADQKVIDDIQEKLKALRVVDRISDDKYYDKYDLTKEKYTEVVVKEGNDIVRRILFGKKSTASQHTYVRVDKEPAVFMASGTFDYYLDKNLNDLRDKNILTFNKEKISSFAITYKGQTFTFIKSKEPSKAAKDKGKDKKDDKKGKKSWICKEFSTVKINDFRISTYLSSFENLKGDGFSQRAVDSLKNPLLTIQIRGDKKQVSIQVFSEGAKDDLKYFAVSTEGPFVYSINEWSVKRYFIENIHDLKAQK